MALSTLVPLRDSVDVPTEGGGVTALPLYGLGADAIAFMAETHGEAFGQVYSMAVAGKISVDNIGDVVTSLLQEAPVLVATVIAFGCREPEAIEQAAALPLSVQLEAVEKIVRLTFAGKSAPKKAAEIVSLLIGALNDLVPPAASTSGSGVSASL